MVNKLPERSIQETSLNPENKELASGVECSPWTGQRWAKYSVEIPAIGVDKEQKINSDWSGQQWNKYA